MKRTEITNLKTINKKDAWASFFMPFIKMLFIFDTMTEEDIKAKIIIPYIQDLGFNVSEIILENLLIRT